MPKTSTNLAERLSVIQRSLNAPKGQFNKFGKYTYRSCEDILHAVKKLLSFGSLHLTISDEVISIDGRFYIKATATISDGTDQISASAFAREDDSKKGMDLAQLTGSTSSYARKYALNGLLCIDDMKDNDSETVTNPTLTIEPNQEEGRPSIPQETLALFQKMALLQSSAEAIIGAIDVDDPGAVKQCWDELTKDEKGLIWTAKSKGGWFTQAQKDAIRNREKSTLIPTRETKPVEDKPKQ